MGFDIIYELGRPEIYISLAGLAAFTNLYLAISFDPKSPKYKKEVDEELFEDSDLVKKLNDIQGEKIK